MKLFVKLMKFTSVYNFYFLIFSVLKKLVVIDKTSNLEALINPWSFCIIHFILPVKTSTLITVKKVVPQTLSPPGSVPWQQQQSMSPTPPSPSSLSSGSVSPVGLSPARHDVSWTPPHPSDLSLSSSSICSNKTSSHFWQSAPVSEWSKEQVILFYTHNHNTLL